MTETIQVGPYTRRPEPFMGPVINRRSFEALLHTQATLKTDRGVCLTEMRVLHENSLFLTPGITDVTQIPDTGEMKRFLGPPDN